MNSLPRPGDLLDSVHGHGVLADDGCPAGSAGSDGHGLCPDQAYAGQEQEQYTQCPEPAVQRYGLPAPPGRSR